MAELEDLLTLREASEVSGVGYQTLLAAAKNERLKVAKWTERGGKKTPLLVLRDDVMAFKASRPGRGFIAFDKQYARLMDLLGSALTEAQFSKVKEVLTEDEYRRIHYAA